MGRQVNKPARKKERVVNFRIQLSPQAKQKLVEVSSRSSFTQLSLCSRLVEWFARQPDLLQNEVMGLYPMSLKKDVARLIREELAE